MTIYKFEYQIITPKQPPIHGFRDVKGFSYWLAYFTLRNILKKEYGTHPGTNILIKRHEIEI